ncbi:SGNH/GDSL hydrolase family protein [Shewanella waksmanii]|uniref:SGNH/GDSL hydrolase family protein n=1 Tax=Shewanella waksmanii TaxID=213783 RepID=UPI003735CB9D
MTTWYYRILPLLLSPLLLLQALRVKSNTLRLPEPDGERESQPLDKALPVNDKPKLSVLLFGDSAAAGVGASSQAKALSGQVVAQLSHSFDVIWRLHGRSGLTTQGAKRWLSKLDAQHYDVVVVSLGVNDIFRPLSQKQWLNEQQQLIEQIQQQCTPQMLILSAVPPLEYFSALPQPLRYCMGLRARLFNLGLHQQVQTMDKIAVLSIPNEQGQLSLAEDGFHPSEQSYQVWAQVIADTCDARFS